jgi:hypothetical protein
MDVANRREKALRLRLSSALCVQYTGLPNLLVDVYNRIYSYTQEVADEN